MIPDDETFDSSWEPGMPVAEPKPKWEAGDEPNTAKMEPDERVPPFAAQTSTPLAAHDEGGNVSPARQRPGVHVPTPEVMALISELQDEARGSWAGSDVLVRAADMLRALASERDARPD